MEVDEDCLFNLKLGNDDDDKQYIFKYLEKQKDEAPFVTEMKEKTKDQMMREAKAL